jgi:hypothetical protein
MAYEGLKISLPVVHEYFDAYLEDHGKLELLSPSLTGIPGHVDHVSK